MFPRSPRPDYTIDINKLFLRHNENDIFSSNPYTTTSLYQSPPLASLANRSSSSADSTSPESFPDLCNRSDASLRSDIFNRNVFNTPKTERRQRPIVGRKILGNPESLQSSPRNFNSGFEITDIDEQNCLNINNSFTAQNYTPNYYELFPTENKGIELTTPLVSPSNTVQLQISPNSSQHYPMFRPTLANNLDASRYIGPSSSNIGPDFRTKMCTFCRKNGEASKVYMTHCVKEKIGNRNVVTCPILRSHVCSTCGATGDDAHTITYCPIMRSNNNGLPLQSTTITLKNTRIKSNGRRRY